MPVATIPSFVEGLISSQLLAEAQCAEVRKLAESAPDVRELAVELLRRDWLTAFQINQILQGKGSELTLGPFVLLERIGEGGMGQVFKARQKVLNRVVALKVIRKQCVNNPKVIKRFQREIRAAGQLSHPHIVRAYDADQIDGNYYIAMEFIDGADLSKLIKDGGPLPINQACEYIRQAALGLQHAFERGMVHRDIKPANLLVARAIASDRRRSSGLIPRPLNLPPAGGAANGSGISATIQRTSGAWSRIDAGNYPWGMVKILDMGLARCTDPFTGQCSTHLTQLGSVMGTPEYIAPEQARDPHNSDVRADLYSLGCTMYFLLTGQPPFPTGTLTEKLMQHQLDEAPAVSQVRRGKLQGGLGDAACVSDEMLHIPPQVNEVLRRLLAKRPEERFQTPVELANELQTILTRMADGTLPKPAPVKPVGPDSIIILPPSVEVESPTTAEMSPHAKIENPSVSPKWWAALIALAVTTFGGLMLIVLVTVIAVLMSRGNFTQAGVADSPPARSKGADEKRTPRN